MDAGQEKSPAFQFRPLPFLHLSSLSSVSCLLLLPVQSLITLGLGGGVPQNGCLGLAQGGCSLAKVKC